MLTIDAARALGLDDQVGSLEPGKQADFVVIDVDTPRHQPYSNLPSVLMNSVTAGDIETVVVDGDVLMRNKSVESLDVERVHAAAMRERERLQAQTGWKTSLAAVHPRHIDTPTHLCTARTPSRDQYGHGVVHRYSDRWSCTCLFTLGPTSDQMSDEPIRKTGQLALQSSRHTRSFPFLFPSTTFQPGRRDHVTKPIQMIRDVLDRLPDGGCDVGRRPRFSLERCQDFLGCIR
nr:amidohydrolase family protein [Halobellus limi]